MRNQDDINFTKVENLYIFLLSARCFIITRSIVFDSAPSLGVYYFLSLTLSVCLFVTLLQIDSSLFLFLDGIEPFLAVSSPCGTLQNVVLRFLI